MNKKRSRNKKRLLLIAILLVIVFYFFLNREKRVLSFDKEFLVTLNYDNLIFETKTNSKTVEEFLKEKNIKLKDEDIIFPEKSASIYSGENIQIIKAKEILILVDGKEIEAFSTEKNVREALKKNNVTLSRLDKTNPDLDFPIQDDLEIVVTRINVEVTKEIEEIDFEIIAKKDKELGWREKKVTQQGVPGKKEIVYEITYKNGKEISRKKLSQEIIKEPVEQIETQGTYMKLGKERKGQGTWYAYKGGMFAASTTIPKGNYAKVTSLASGKSIVVQINDYGPQGKGRIIDLDKVAFQALAPLGAGVIGVKVEEILN